MRQIFLFNVILFAALATQSFAQLRNDSLVRQKIDVFSAVFRKVTDVYPEPVDPEKTIVSAIAPMLETLDQFSRFYTQSEASEMTQRLTRNYGGIGVVAHETLRGVIVFETVPGAPAEKAGIEAADEITAIDGKSMKGIPFDEVFDLLKGEPQSQITVTVRKPPYDKAQSYTFNRAIIHFSPVRHTAMLNNEIAYLKLASESRNSAKQVADALANLYKSKQFKKLVLDLRGNEGGYLDEAVKIANLFAAKNALLVKVAKKDRDSSYFAAAEPLYPSIPMAVLVDDFTVSSGEILAGALQDNDRAVFIGQKTFGKGLVQEIFDMPGNTQLMLTTGCYYTPCGRCIQAFDHQGAKIEDGQQKVFKTKNGRTVYASGGIAPDIATVKTQQSNLCKALLDTDIIFDFATQYKLRHSKIPPLVAFGIDDTTYEAFTAFAKERLPLYQTETENHLEALRESAINDGSWKFLEAFYARAKSDLLAQKQQQFLVYKTEICRALGQEIVSRYYKSGRLQHALLHDGDVNKAIEVLTDAAMYRKILNID